MTLGNYDSLSIPDDPTEQLPFGIGWTPESGDYREFAPEYYPDRFPQTKELELSRHGQQCGGEDISIKAIKNAEFHIAGVALASEVPLVKQLQNREGVVDLYSPLSPTGGVECFVTTVEVDATPNGFDPLFREWKFEYTLDLVSTGTDEYDRGTNGIVTAILGTPPERRTGSDTGVI